MRMVKNVWKPDTCGCTLEFEFDADEPEETRTHTPTRVIGGCAAHPVDEKVKHYDKVLEENRRKNFAMKDVLEQVAEDKKKDVTWRFDENRDVIIEVPDSEKGKITLNREKVKLA